MISYIRPKKLPHLDMYLILRWFRANETFGSHNLGIYLIFSSNTTFEKFKQEFDL